MSLVSLVIVFKYFIYEFIDVKARHLQNEINSISSYFMMFQI